MATSLWDLLGSYKIIIPILQRDYAQGRQTGKVPVIRERFLNALSSAIESKNMPLELDFVYGYINGAACFIPLDGQQRLTTLFLLHWFVAVKENHLEEAKELLSKFTYETRHSSRVFCEKLVQYKPDNLLSPVAETIINEAWFFTAWKNDPTISSMLTMLNAIQNKFINIENIWPLLTSENPLIVFHLLPMEKLGLPDDLYIKMNSRGKELSEFEHFKSRFSEILSPKQAEIFNKKIDQEWSDLFWNLYKDKPGVEIAKLVDNGFLRFFNFVTDILIAKNTDESKSLVDNFDTYKNIYGQNEENVSYLFSCLNTFCAVNKDNPKFFDSIFYIKVGDFDLTKTKLFFNDPAIDLFKKCADNYDVYPNQPNPFSIGEQLLLFACLEHLIKKTEHFNTQVRKVRNLISNSEDTVRKDNMTSLLGTVSEIIVDNQINTNSKFNSTQTKEEQEKELFIGSHPELKEAIYKLEDHFLLQGCIAIFNLTEDLNDYQNSFCQIFNDNCDYEVISSALLTFGDYSQQYSWRRRFGNRNKAVWRELFTPSQRRLDFQATKNVLHKLLFHIITNPDSTLQEIIDNYLDSFEKQLDKSKAGEYYYIKYKEFRKNEDGYYFWNDRKNKPYECIMMRRSTLGGFNWSPFLFTLKSKLDFPLDLNNSGGELGLTINNATIKIANHNNAYKIFANEDNESKILLSKIQRLINLSSDYTIEIAQNEDGIDIDDRIKVGITIIDSIISSLR